MSKPLTRCIALTQELEAYIRAQVASGQYTSASEVVRAGLRLLIERGQTLSRSRSSAEAVMPPHVSAGSP